MSLMGQYRNRLYSNADHTRRITKGRDVTKSDACAQKTHRTHSVCAYSFTVRRVMSAFCEVTRGVGRRCVSVLSNVTARYLGLEQKGRVSLLKLTCSSPSASLLLRWKTANTVFVVLSLNFPAMRDDELVAKQSLELGCSWWSLSCGCLFRIF